MSEQRVMASTDEELLEIRAAMDVVQHDMAGLSDRYVRLRASLLRAAGNRLTGEVALDVHEIRRLVEPGPVEGAAPNQLMAAVASTVRKHRTELVELQEALSESEAHREAAEEENSAMREEIEALREQVAETAQIREERDQLSDAVRGVSLVSDGAHCSSTGWAA